MAFACGRCVECDGGRGYEFCVSPRGINYVPPNPWPTIRHAYDEMRAQRDALAEALRMAVHEIENYGQIEFTKTEVLDAALAALAKVTP